MLRELVNEELVTCEPDAKISDVAKMMSEENVGCVLVTEDDMPTGIITDRDIVVRCIAKNIDVDDCTVEQVMSEAVETVREDEGIFDCIQKMHKHGVRRIPVVDTDGKAIGVISFGDLLAILSKELYQLTQRTTPLEEAEERDETIKAA